MKAIVFVDVQNDFIKSGKLAFGYPEKDNLDKIVEYAKECVANNYAIYATRDTHIKTVFEDVGTIIKFDEYGSVSGTKRINGQPSSGYLSTLEGQKLPVEHCVEGTEGWQIVDPLMDVLLGKATFVNKPTFGSYDLVNIIDEDIQSGNILKNHSKEKKIDEMYEPLEEIVIVGYDLSICVLANAVLLRAKYPNMKISVKVDLCGDVNKEAFDAAVKVLQMQQIDVETIEEK